MFSDLAKKCRTARSFDPKSEIPYEDLLKLVDDARISASARNLQRIKYKIIVGKEADEAYSYFKLGGALKPEEKPTYDDRAPAYIALYAPENDTDSNLFIDVGIASEVIMLSACDMGYAGCIIRSYNPAYLKSLIKTEGYAPVCLIALGKSGEIAEIIEVVEGDSITYYKENGKHMVPKYTLESVLIK